MEIRMTDALVPPPEYVHLRWHWLTHCSGAKRPIEWTGSFWKIGKFLVKPKAAYISGWRYHDPCVPFAITLNPEDPTQIKAVIGQIESVCSDGNSDARRVAVDVLRALKEMKW